MIFFPVLLGLLTCLASAAVLPRSAGCGKAPGFASGSFDTRLTNADRRFRIWLPASYDQNSEAPLILSFHGGGQNISRMIEVDRFSQPAINNDHVVVYLQGLPHPVDGTTAWQGVPGVAADDLGFTTAVLNHLESNFCIDRKRIYATGFSMGGGITDNLACDAGLSSRFAAFAPVSGAHYTTVDNLEADCKPGAIALPCSPGRQGVPIRTFHGGADGTIPYLGGQRRGACLPHIEHWTRAWAERNGLNLDSKEVKAIQGQGGEKARTITYGANGLVQLVYVGDDGKHGWPGMPNNPVNLDASKWIMEFFRSYP